MGILERELDYYRPMVAMIRVSAILKSRCCFSNVKPTLSDHSGRTLYRIRNWRRSLDNQRCHLQRYKTRRNLRSSKTNPRKSRFSFWDTLERSMYLSQDEPNELTVTIANSRQLIPCRRRSPFLSRLSSLINFAWHRPRLLNCRQVTSSWG